MKTIFTTLLWVCVSVYTYASDNPCSDWHTKSCGESYIDDNRSGPPYTSLATDVKNMKIFLADGIDCSSATFISCGDTKSGQSNKSGSNKSSAYSCKGSDLSNYNGKERIYKLTLDRTEDIDIRLTDIAGSGVNFDMFLYEYDCDSGNCWQLSTNSGQQDETISGRLPAGTHYIIIDTWHGEEGTFTLSVEGCNDPGPEVDCDDAITMDCGVQYHGNTWGESNDFNREHYKCQETSYSYNGGDQIYRIRKDHYTDRLQIHLYTEDPDLNVYLMSGCESADSWNSYGSNSSSNPSLSCIKEGEVFYGGRYIDEGSFGLSSGWYYIIVDGKYSYTDAEYMITVTCGSPDFDDAEELTCNSKIDDHHLRDGKNEMSIYSCGYNHAYGLISKERTYWFNVTEDKEMEVRLSNMSYGAKMNIYLYKSDYGSEDCWIIGQNDGLDKVIKTSSRIAITISEKI